MSNGLEDDIRGEAGAAVDAFWAAVEALDENLVEVDISDGINVIREFHGEDPYVGPIRNHPVFHTKTDPDSFQPLDHDIGVSDE